jgi:hypothetical protein
MMEMVTIREFWARVKNGRYVFPSLMEDIPLTGNEKLIYIVNEKGSYLLLEPVCVSHAVDGVSIIVKGAVQVKELLDRNNLHT